MIQGTSGRPTSTSRVTRSRKASVISLRKMVQTMCGRMALAFAGNAGDLRLECVVEKGVGKVGAGGTRQYVRQRAVVGDSTVVQEVEPVAKVLRFAHDVRRDQHGPPGGALAADGFREEPSADHVERSGGFVQQEHAGLMEEGPGDIGALLLSAGQRAAEAVSAVGVPFTEIRWLLSAVVIVKGRADSA